MAKKTPRRAITLDKESTPDPPDATKVVHTVEQIGPRQSRTPEGFLLCEAVPIARIGLMMYGPGETPITEGEDGLCWITRDAATLFAATCIASFMGKDVVDEHPMDDVSPSNWRQFSEGVVLNVRQGTGDDADVLLADLLIKDEGVIRDIEAGKREVSAGYEADYEQTGPGTGVQSNIIGNHVALVRRGRCGPRCAIGDHSHNPETKEDEMATQTTRRSIPAKQPRVKITQATLDALQELIDTNGEPDASTMDEGELTGKADGGTHIHIHGLASTAPATQGAGGVNATDEGAAAGGAAGSGNNSGDPYEARFTSIENSVKELTAAVQSMVQAASGKGGAGGSDPTGDAAGDKDEDDKKTEDADDPFAKKDDDEDKEKDKSKDRAMTGDSSALANSYQALVADAEILVPGFRVSTFDAKAQRKVTVDAMCGSRRKALDTAYATQEGQILLENVAGTKNLNVAGMTCDAVATLFRAAVGAKKLLNTTRQTQDAGRMGTQTQEHRSSGVSAPTSVAELNKRNREFYAEQAKKLAGVR